MPNLYKKKDKTFEQVGDTVEYTITEIGTVKIGFKGAIDLASGGAISVNEVEEYTLKYDEFLKDKKSVEMPF